MCERYAYNSIWLAVNQKWWGKNMENVVPESFSINPHAQYLQEGILEDYERAERSEKGKKTPRRFETLYATYVRREGSFARKGSRFIMYGMTGGFEARKEKIELPYPSSFRKKYLKMLKKRVKVGERMHRGIGTQAGMTMIDAYEIAHEEKELLQGAGWPLAHEVMGGRDRRLLSGYNVKEERNIRLFHDIRNKILEERNTRLLHDIQDEMLKEHFGEVVVIARGECIIAETFDDAIKAAREKFPDEEPKIIWRIGEEEGVPRVPRVGGIRVRRKK